MSDSAALTPSSSSVGRRWQLIAVCLLGAGLRAWGLSWGLPRVNFNPDELHVLQITQRLSWSSLDPRFYNYSGLTFHLNFFATELSRALGAPIDDASQLFVHRLLSLLFATLTVYLVYPIARRLRLGHATALLATLVFALVPLHVWNSHYSVADVGLTFWMTLALLQALRAYEKPTLGQFLLGGAIVGAAIGTKFTGALAGTSYIAAAALVWWEGRLRPQIALRNLFAAGAFSLVAFALTSPYSVIHLRDTAAAFRYEWIEVQGGHYGFDMTAEGWQYRRGLYQVGAMFPFSFGLALWPIVVFGTAVFAWRGTAMQRAMGLSFVGLYLATTADWTLVPLRYYLPILPMAAVCAAYGLETIRRGRLPRALSWGVMALVLGYTALYTGATVDRYRLDTRTLAGDWGDRTLPRDARVYMLYPAVDDSYMPAFARDDIHVQPVPLEKARTLLPIARRTPERTWIVVSSLTYQRDYRQGAYATRPDAHRRWHHAADPIAEWNFIRNNPDVFRLEKRFSAWFPNKALYMYLDPMYEGYFVSPTLEFYRLDESREKALQRRRKRQDRLTHQDDEQDPPR